MGSREDDAYWGSKYAEAWCHYHEEEMHYDEDAEHWACFSCENEGF